MNTDIIFKPLSLEDCGRLYQWLQLPHVKAFWDDGDRTLEEVEARYSRKDKINRYLFFIDKIAVGFAQSYIVDVAHEYAEFISPNQKTIGIDFFIGNEQFLGKGYAFPALSQFIAKCCQNADCILVDPSAINEKAIHIYKKYGFIKLGECNIKNELHWIMIAELDSIFRV